MTDTSTTPEKAFNKGCMWGMSGGSGDDCPYATESEQADHWQQGWQEGRTAWEKCHPAQATG